MYHVKMVIAEIDIGAESPQDLQGFCSFIQQPDGAGNYISSFVNGIRQRNGEIKDRIQQMDLQGLRFIFVFHISSGKTV